MSELLFTFKLIQSARAQSFQPVKTYKRTCKCPSTYSCILLLLLVTLLLVALKYNYITTFNW